ncbi:hypothetical protein JKP88DRAFT_215489 [Tribonema minus]|uniref:Uncharacterized protein n=1 Tax=Tribonema minus TaxID=303371 RepID=A0A835YQN6_9STRA|nr:hypothetical protein JKP88DRAFT_215489 [Tribonema minus]
MAAFASAMLYAHIMCIDVQLTSGDLPHLPYSPPLLFNNGSCKQSQYGYSGDQCCEKQRAAYAIMVSDPFRSSGNADGPGSTAMSHSMKRVCLRNASM